MPRRGNPIVALTGLFFGMLGVVFVFWFSYALIMSIWATVEIVQQAPQSDFADGIGFAVGSIAVYVHAALLCLFSIQTILGFGVYHLAGD